MRRGTQITPIQFNVTCSSKLGYYDLVREVHRSKVHDFATKVRLAEVLELLVELCIILTDILDLAFPIEESLKQSHGGPLAICQIRTAQVALHKWYREATLRLPNPPTSSQTASPGKHHDSVVLYTNLVYMYY